MDENIIVENRYKTGDKIARYTLIGTIHNHLSAWNPYSKKRKPRLPSKTGSQPTGSAYNVTK